MGLRSRAFSEQELCYYIQLSHLAPRVKSSDSVLTNSCGTLSRGAIPYGYYGIPKYYA